MKEILEHISWGRVREGCEIESMVDSVMYVQAILKFLLKIEGKY